MNRREPRRAAVAALAWLLAAIAGAGGAAAEDAVERVNVEVVCPLVGLDTSPEGAVVGTVGRGAVDGVIEGGRGVVYRLLDSGELLQLGEATVVAVEDEEARVALAAADPAGPGFALGDAVYVPARVPRIEPRPVSWRLAIYGVTLLDEDEAPLFDFRAIAADPAADHDAVVCERGAALMRSVAPLADAVEVGREPLAAGRFAGKTLRQILEGATAEEFRDFLLYLVNYPGDFIGNSWRTIDLYGAWAVAELPPCPEEILVRTAGMDAAAREAYLAGLADSLVADDAVDDFYREAHRLIGAGELARADQVVALMQSASAITGRDRDWDLTWSALADLRKNQGDLDGAVEAHQRALEVAAADPASQAVTLLNLGGALRGAGRCAEALPHYERALRLQQEIVAGGAAAWGIEATYWGMGRCLEAEYRYPEALQAYSSALQHYREQTDVEGIEGEAQALLDVGDVHEAMGSYALAIEAREQVLGIARELGWQETVAEALGDISDGYWNLGDYAHAIAAREEALADHRALGDEYAEAVCLTNLGELYGVIGDRAAGQEHYEQARAIHERRGERWDVADVLLRMAQDHRAFGDYTAALALLEQAAAIHDEQGDVSSGVGVQREIAENLQAQGRHEEADAAYARALEGSVAVGDRVGEALTLLWWGSSLQARRDGDGALERFDRCRAIQAEIGDRAGEADTLRQLASLFTGLRGEHERARALAEESLALARAMPSVPKEAAALAVIGDVLSNAGAFDESYEHYRQALELYEGIGDLQGTIQTRGAVAYLYEQWGEREQALALYEASLQAARDSGNRRLEANALSQRGWVLAGLTRYDEAIESAEAAVAIMEELNETWGLGNAYNTLGSIHHDLGHYQQALEWHHQALRIRRGWGDPYGEAGSLNNIGSLHIDLGDHDAAVEHLEAALAIGERIGYVDVLTTTTGNLAYCYAELDQPERTLALAQDGLATALAADVPPRVAQLRRLEGLAHRQLGDHEHAELVLSMALDEAEELGMVFAAIQARSQLGIVAWEQGDLEAAEALLREAADEARRYPNPNQRWEPLFYLGRTLRDRGDVDGAIEVYEEAVATLEQMKAGIGGSEDAEERFQVDHDDVYLELVDLLERQGRGEEAWERLGRMKTRELQDLAPGDLSEVVAEEDRAALEQAEELRTRELDLERQLRAELDKPADRQRPDLVSRLQSELDQVQLRFQDFTRALQQDHPELYGRLQISPPSFFKLQADLRDGEAFLEPVILPDRVVVFVVRAGSAPLLYREVPVEEREVHRLIRDMRVRLETPAVPWEATRGTVALTANPGGLDPAASAQALYELLIAPVAADLDGVETLIVSPSGRLRYIPFAALYDGEQYLVDRYRVVMLTQAGALADHEAIPRRAPLLALGNPDGSLPGAEAEVDALQQAWSRKAVSTYVGGEATKAVLRQQVADHQILHLATHGVLRHDNPEASYLLLAGEGPAAQLSFREIPLLPLSDVHLVVLSACHTAMGDRGEGTEIAGLAYQFEMRGADSVVASLWAVSDASTTELMLAFYEQLEQGNGTKADALRAAQLALRTSEQHGHPYYWAPFVLIGDWR